MLFTSCIKKWDGKHIGPVARVASYISGEMNSIANDGTNQWYK